MSREILYYYNGVTCSKELDISYNVITRRLNDGKAFISKSRKIKLIRIPIFKTNKKHN